MELQDYEKEHIHRLRDYLPECTVLLKSNGDFPLEAPCPVALYGSGARRTVKGGTGSGEVNSHYFDSVETGLEKAGFSVTTKAWLDAYDDIAANAAAAFRRQLRARAKEQHVSVMALAMGAAMPEPEYELPLDGAGELAVYVLARTSGEGADRVPEKGDVLLTDTERRDIGALKEKYKKFLLVLNVGGPVDLSPVLDTPNILLLGQLGVETGDALADVILGRQSPSGKLTTTWAAWKAYPKLDFGKAEDTRYREGVFVGYRWFDTAGAAPLFPFGYGLSFTDFAIDDCAVSLAQTRVTVHAQVRNVGAYAGKEVVQVYASVPAGALTQPYQMLAGWAKTPTLQPGGQVTAEISFDLRELASYDAEAAAYVLEAGDYILRVGNSSRSTAAQARLRLDRTVAVRRVKNALGVPDFADEALEPAADDEADVPVLPVDAEDISTETVSYETQTDIDPRAAALADEQLALLSVGAFSKGGLISMIGRAAKTVCGAAGEIAALEGLPRIVMADGPAGVRIHAQYFEDESGRHSMEPGIPASLLSFLPGPLRRAAGLLQRKPKAPSQIRSQYCTAIPIATALAQSWNLEFAQLCGDIVGDEMERFDVDLWLAPALNIHRSILCGRNFEYFSEDPLVSGRFAAALTRGVQAHPGKGATVKHFAANNQEFCRTSNNSAVSERALREIYLKGFEICIREAAPRALMTSYNLINRRHTATRRDLIEDVLRREFGFRGIVMTDWVVAGGMVPRGAKYPGPKAGDVAAAGGDLFMPGSEKDFYDVLHALQAGKLSRTQLQINATRILHWMDD